MSRWQFEIENEIETFEVKPQGIENRLKWEPVGERVFDFKKSITDLTFIGDDYSKLLQYELTNHCTEQTLRVYQYCGLVRKLRFTAKFSMSSGKWDRDKCVVQFTIKESDKYLCVKRKKEYNVFDVLVPNEQIGLGLILTFDNYWCWNDGNPNATQVCDENFLIDNHWGFHSTHEVSNNTLFQYLRLVIYVPIGTIIDDDNWHFATSDLADKWKYVREYVDEDHRNLFITLNGHFDYSTTQMFFVDQLEVMKNGFHLYNLLNELLKKNCPDLKIVSDFFQWNPETEAEINYVTGQPSKITNLKLFQKSDIKRPNSSNPATKQETAFIKLLTDLCRVFNCGYRVSGNVLRIEHIKWFEQQENLDLVQIAQDTEQITLMGTHRYSYDKTKLPKYEYFEWMDEVSDEFEGTPIWYDNGCVEDDDDLAESLTNRIEYVTTDMLECFTSPDVSDSGFVLVACDKSNNVIWEQNILNGGSLPNNVLSWPNLHRNFWKHGRPQLVGYMNVPVDAEEPTGTIFASSIAVKDQSPFAIQLCCDHISEFDPSGLQNSIIGWGEVKSAELDLFTDIMVFELMFKQSQ